MAGFHDKTTQIVFKEEGGRPVRVILLLVSGLLLVGGVWIWISAHHGSDEEPLPLVASAPPLAAPGHAPTAQAGKSAAPAVKPGPAAQPGPPAQPGPSTQPAASKDGQAPQASAAAPPGKADAASGPAREPAAAMIPERPLPEPIPGEKNLPATPRLLAAQEARLGAGRNNPATRVDGFKPFPRYLGELAPTESGGPADASPPVAEKTPFVPPPPPEATPSLGEPPSVDEGLPLAELPAPPSKPSIANQMRLMAVIGDRVVLAFSDGQQRREHGWPKTVTLGPGDQFESVSVVSVGPDSVTLDEDGDRSVKTIDRLR